jgi:hypothetical protein
VAQGDYDVVAKDFLDLAAQLECWQDRAQP